MDLKMIRRASALAILAFALSATAVFADTIPADGDVIPGNQGNVDLGSKEPGELVTREVNFSLVCSGSSHAIAGQTATIQPSSYGKPLDGTIVSTSTTIGPVPSNWPVAPAGCGSSPLVVPSSGPVTVTLRMPTTPGIDYQYTVIYARLGVSGLSGSTVITFTVDVEANTPPTLTMPAPITAEATSPAGAIVNYTPAATDAQDDPDPTPSCVPASGSQFPLGKTTVDCTVTDSESLTTTGSFDVTVNDTIAPSLGLPGTITAEATSPAGAEVSYSVTATDVADATPTLGCSPLPGATFALGTTTVDCTAVDDAGNVASGSFDVVVSDTTAPTLVLPGALTAEATGSDGAAVTYVVTSADAVDAAPTVVCAPASGSTFALGTTAVSCTSTDASGNAAVGSFDVRVADSAAPVLSDVPGDISVSTTNAAGRPVTWAAPSATDAVGGPVPVACAPASGSTFPVGTTTVTCTATDGPGNAASATFGVTVTLEDEPPAPPPYEVTWGEPIDGGTLEANQSRTVPLKIRLFLEGVEVTAGTALLSVAPCGGGDPVMTVSLVFNGGRWQGHLDTGSLNLGCYTVSAIVDGHAAGSFTLDLRGAEPTSSPKPKNDKPKK